MSGDTGTLKGYDRTALAPELTGPTLFLGGRYDCCTPEETRCYHHLVPGSERVVFEESSHSPFCEEPAHFLAVVAEFLQRIEARAKAAGQDHDGGRG